MNADKDFPVIEGLRCEACHYETRPRPGHGYLVNPDQILFRCPMCPGTKWEAIPNASTHRSEQ